MLATDLRGLRRQCAEAEAAYYAEVKRIRSLQDEIEALKVHEKIADASSFVERAREVSEPLVKALREAQEAMERGDSEIDALEAKRKKFEDATKDLVEKAREAQEVAARVEQMDEESRKSAEETARIMRTCLKLSGTPISAQRVFDRWRNFTKASIFDKNRATRQMFSLWRRSVVSSLLAVAAADRLRPAAAIRRWRTRVKAGDLKSYAVPRSAELERAIEEMGLRNRKRGIARAVLYRWHDVTERASYRRRIFAWQSLRVSRAVERFRRTNDDDDEDFATPRRRPRRLRRRLGLEQFVSAATRCFLRLALSRWRSATKRIVFLSIAVRSLSMSRIRAIESRRRLVIANSFFVRKALKRWSRRRAVWAIRRAFRLLSDNARRRRVAIAVRWRSFVLTRRCFAAWRVEWIREQKLRDEEFCKTVESAQRAREDELRRATKAAAASQDLPDLIAYEKELEEKLARNEQILASMPEFDRDKLEAALRAREELGASRRREELRTLCGRLADTTRHSGEIDLVVANLSRLKDEPGAAEMMAEVVSSLEAELESVRIQEAAAIRAKEVRDARLARLDDQLETVEADAKATVAKYTQEISEQYNANASLQMKLAKHKSESHLRLRIRKLCRENEKTDSDGARRPSLRDDHLHNSLISALQAKRDYLYSKSTGRDEEDDTFLGDGAAANSTNCSSTAMDEFFQASQQLLAEIDPPLPPLPPLRKSRQ